MADSRQTSAGSHRGPVSFVAAGHARGVNFARVLACALVLLVVVATARRACAADEATPTEDQVKAAFLLNFPKYVDWPPSAFAGAASPIVLTVLGDRNLEEELRRMSAGKSFGGRAIEVRAAGGPAEISGDCLILFVGASERRHLPGILERLGAAPVLTVGDDADFLDEGGMINLNRDGRKIRLEVNLAAPGADQLKISSKLLSVAAVVRRKKGP